MCLLCGTSRIHKLVLYWALTGVGGPALEGIHRATLRRPPNAGNTGSKTGKAMGQGGIFMNRMAWQLTRIARAAWIGTAVAVAAWGNNAFADQQEVRASEKPPSQVAANDTGGGADTSLDEVVVTGIRYSLKESLAAMRAS